MMKSRVQQRSMGIRGLAVVGAVLLLLACNPAPLGITPTPAASVVEEAPPQAQVVAPTATPAPAGPCPRTLTGEEEGAIADVVRRYQEALAALDRARVASYFTLRLQNQPEGAIILSTIDEARTLGLKGGSVLPVSAVQAVDDGAVVTLEGATARLQLIPEGQGWKILTTRFRADPQLSRVLALGTAIDVGDLRVTFTRGVYAESVEDPATKTIIRPAASGVFLVFYYTAENRGKERIVPATALNAKLAVYDKDGRHWEFADENDKGNVSARFAAAAGGESPERALGAGFSMSTAVAFEVPSNAVGLCVPVGQLRLVVPKS